LKRHSKKSSKKKRKKQLNLIFGIFFLLAGLLLFFQNCHKNTSFSYKKNNGSNNFLEAKIKISIVMDDLGQSLEPLNWFLENKYPITLSFLPNLPYTKILSEKLYQKGYEIIIHIPMEPNDFPKVNPGSDAIFLSMDKSKIKEKIMEFKKELPFAIGANNHMGSRFTSDLNKMICFMEVLKENNLFFLDSRTTAETKGFEAAKATGVLYLERDVFLDNVLELAYVKRQFEALIKKAKVKGYGIGICHPHKETFKILKEILPYYKKKVNFSYLKDLTAKN